MFDPILVPLDGSLFAECVLSHTVEISRAFNAKAMLLRVLDKDQQHLSATDRFHPHKQEQYRIH
jgi:nucleotide-binding universal stress UspA family protein